MICYRCNGEGHMRADCPMTEADAAGEQAPIHAGPLSDGCPACGAQPGHTCCNLVTGGPMYRAGGTPATHPARLEPVWRDPALAQRRRDLRMVSERD